MNNIIDIDGKEREKCVVCGRGMWFDGFTSDYYCPICTGKFTKEHYYRIMKGPQKDKIMGIDCKEHGKCDDCGREIWNNGMGGPNYCPVCSGNFLKEHYDRIMKGPEEDE